MVIHAVEHFDGKTMYRASRWIFLTICMQPLPISSSSASHSHLPVLLSFRQACRNIKVYPNPSTDDVTLEFSNPQHYVYSLFIYDTKGQKLREIDNISSGEVKLSNENLARGMYFYSLRNRWGIAGRASLWLIRGLG